MCPRWLAALSVAALLAVPGCRSVGDPAPASAEPLRVTGPAFEPPAHLCDALPRGLVAEATGRSPVTVDGAGTQCSWRAASPSDGTDVVLQGSFIDARSFEVGRPDDGGATSIPDLGDDAYLVEVDGEAPTTLYVRDGHRAFALWLTGPSGRAEGALTRLALQVLAA